MDDGVHSVGIIDYELTGGLGGVHMSVHIDPDGSTMRVKSDGSTETSQLDAQDLAELHREVNRAKFETLDPLYEGDVADDFIHTFTVSIDGNFYTVVTSGFADYPERLQPLLGTLSSMSRAPLALE